ncbi:hypothetical protein [Lysinibacillus sp. NPDC096212]|uniref:hypothetical protein n=1 Tax=Lysinibacillus sp. NPDC096212 TaxID=3364135 RepID=UPI00382A4864
MISIFDNVSGLLLRETEQIFLLPDQFFEVPERFIALPDQFFRLPERFIALPDQISGLPERFILAIDIILEKSTL